MGTVQGWVNVFLDFFSGLFFTGHPFEVLLLKPLNPLSLSYLCPVRRGRVDFVSPLGVRRVFSSSLSHDTFSPALPLLSFVGRSGRESAWAWKTPRLVCFLAAVPAALFDPLARPPVAR